MALLNTSTEYSLLHFNLQIYSHLHYFVISRIRLLKQSLFGYSDSAVKMLHLEVSYAENLTKRVT